MDTDATPKKHRVGAMLAAGAACMAVALPVSGAFAQDDQGSNQRTTPDAQQQEQQQDRSEQQRPRDGDCPEKDGNPGEGQSEGSSSGASVYGDAVLQ